MSLPMAGGHWGAGKVPSTQTVLWFCEVNPLYSWNWCLRCGFYRRGQPCPFGSQAESNREQACPSATEMSWSSCCLFPFLLILAHVFALLAYHRLLLQFFGPLSCKCWSSRTVSCQTGVAHWIAACGGLLHTTAVPGQRRRTLCAVSQRRQADRFQLSKSCGGLIQANGAITQPNRSFYNTNKHLSAKDSLQPSEEKVGPFTRLIEALGFTGPLKYSRWKVKVAALRMYTCCVEKTDYEEFFNTVAGVRGRCERQDSSLVIKKLEPHFSCAHTSPQLPACSDKFSSVCRICLSNRGFVGFNWCFTISA
ncbi:uncharacterized protein LOC102091407 isoform X6 [Columba livia]|uniref:uncharacterized protein LOC102091407 isoform X6 n=1 Tax=Columba livia TaxID=8932 RepID=UPI0031BACB61